MDRPTVEQQAQPADELYQRDFYTWANQQAALLRAGDIQSADLAHIAEEIESMGRSEKRELTSRLAILLAHLLKWHDKPDRRSRSWQLTIREQQRQAGRVLRDNPGLKPQLDDILAEAYGDAVLIALRETDLPDAAFPPACPWTADAALSLAV